MSRSRSQSFTGCTRPPLDRWPRSDAVSFYRGSLLDGGKRSTRRSSHLRGPSAPARDRKKERERDRDRVAHGAAPSLKLAVAGVNESRNLLSASLSSFFARSRPALESPTPRERDSRLVFRSLDSLDPLSRSLVVQFSLFVPPSLRVGAKSSFARSSFAIISGHEIALRYANNVAGLIIVPLVRALFIRGSV